MRNGYEYPPGATSCLSARVSGIPLLVDASEKRTRRGTARPVDGFNTGQGYGTVSGPCRSEDRRSPGGAGDLRSGLRRGRRPAPNLAGDGSRGGIHRPSPRPSPRGRGGQRRPDRQARRLNHKRSLHQNRCATLPLHLPPAAGPPWPRVPLSLPVANASALRRCRGQ
jgi:hypothetical protein